MINLKVKIIKYKNENYWDSNLFFNSILIMNMKGIYYKVCRIDNILFKKCAY